MGTQFAGVAGPGILALWVRYTAPTLDRLLDALSDVADTRFRCHPTVVDDGVADVLVDVRSEHEGVEIVAALEKTLGREDGLEVVRATFFPRATAS
jgi:uncharacterized membrane-anchored protein